MHFVKASGNCKNELDQRERSFRMHIFQQKDYFRMKRARVYSIPHYYHFMEKHNRNYYAAARVKSFSNEFV
jgi:hypothetical protein